MNSSTGNRKTIATRSGSISGTWRANQIISKPPSYITIHSLSLNLVTEKRFSRLCRGMGPDLGVRACVRTLSPPNPGIYHGHSRRAGKEIWENESLAQKWGFTEEYHQTVGTGLSDEVAATLPIPKKDELLGYLRNSYETIECFIEQLDSKYPNFENVDEELKKNIEMIRVNLLVFLSHDCRHLSMMECRQGLQTPHASIPHSRGVRGRPALARQRRRDSVTPALPGTGRQDGVRPVQVLRGMALDATTTLAPYASAVAR